MKLLAFAKILFDLTLPGSLPGSLPGTTVVLKMGSDQSDVVWISICLICLPAVTTVPSMRSLEIEEKVTLIFI